MRRGVLAMLMSLVVAMTTAAQAPINTFPYVETFDTFGAINGTTMPAPPGWTQDTMDATGSGGGTDWFFRNTPTTSANTGPLVDHTTGFGFYAHVEDSNASHPDVNLLTPFFDLSVLSRPQLEFWVHSRNNQSLIGVAENFLHVDLAVMGMGVFTQDVVPAIGHIGTDWTRFTSTSCPGRA